MSDSYHSLGGLSPGRPTQTAYQAHQPTLRSSKVLFSTLTILLVIVTILIALFLWPRPLTDARTNQLSQVSFAWVNTTAFHLSIDHSFIINNNNWCPVQMTSSITFVTLIINNNNKALMCSDSSADSTYSTMGSVEVDGDWWLSSRETDNEYHIKEASLIINNQHISHQLTCCMRNACDGVDTCVIALDSIARITYLGVALDRIVETAYVNVTCLDDKMAPPMS